MAEKPGKHVLITGSDEYEVKRRSAEVVSKVKPEDPMNLETLDGAVDSVDNAVDCIGRIREALLTLPFLGGRKVVYVKNTTFLQDTVIGKSERVKEGLADLMEVMEKVSPDEARLVMMASGADKRKAFYKAFAKLGYTESLDLPDIKTGKGEAAWINEVAGRLSKAGLKFEDGVPEVLVECVGNNTRVLEAEIEKLSLYSHPDGMVTLDDLRKIVTSNRSLMVWDLCDSVTTGNTAEAVPLLRQLLAQGDSEVGILILLSNQIRLAAIGVWLKEENLLKLSRRGNFMNVDVTPEGEDLLPANKSGVKPKGFRLAKVVGQASSKTSDRWFRALDICFDTHLQLLSGTGDRHRTLETAVLRLCQI
ncbi:MAG: DNA polymerase III subunit delta [Verrucomicrobiota bacterium]